MAAVRLLGLVKALGAPQPSGSQLSPAPPPRCPRGRSAPQRGQWRTSPRGDRRGCQLNRLLQKRKPNKAAGKDKSSDKKMQTKGLMTWWARVASLRVALIQLPRETLRLPLSSLWRAPWPACNWISFFLWRKLGTVFLEPLTVWREPHSSTWDHILCLKRDRISLAAPTPLWNARLNGRPLPLCPPAKGDVLLQKAGPFLITLLSSRCRSGLSESSLASCQRTGDRVVMHGLSTAFSAEWWQGTAHLSPLLG